MPMSTYCLFCGSNKPSYDEKCPNCNRAPSNETELGKSLLLSTDFMWESAGLPYGEEDIRKIVEKIKSGGQSHFDSNDTQQALLFLQKGRGSSDVIQSIFWGIGFVFIVVTSVWYLFF